MNKIILTKQVNYYNKNDFSHSDIIEKKEFATIKDALKNLQSIKLNYVENKKGISAYEEASILYKDEDNHWLKYNKIIDINTKDQIDNIPKKES